MSFITDIIFVTSGCLELILLIICADILGLYSKSQIHKVRIILALITHILISVLYLISGVCFERLGYLFSLFLYFLRFIPVIFILYKRSKLRILYLMLFCNLSVSLISTSISNIAASIVDTNSRIISPYPTIFIRTAVLFLVLTAGKKSNRQINAAVLKTIPKYIYIMIISAIISLSAMPTLITHGTYNTTVKESLLITITVILTIIFICVIASLLLNVLAKQHFTVKSQMMEEQVGLQIDHYKKLEKMIAQMRKFKHDYTNQLQGVLSLLKGNEYSQAKEYVQELINRKNEFEAELHIFDTGNLLANALLSGKFSALNDGSKIDYSGIIPETLNNVDLCIILSNALDNAVEACNALPVPGVICVDAATRQGYFVLSVKNPTICTDNYYTIPPTTKTDKEQHGMGLYNIESAARKNDGRIKIKCENGSFELTVIMKIYNDE